MQRVSKLFDSLQNALNCALRARHIMWTKADRAGNTVLTEPRHDRTNKMAVHQGRLRSACASTQSDQSLRYPREESLGP